MPKTYNQRQIDQILLEDAHTPQARGDAPDLTRFIRFFSSEEVRQIMQRLEQRVAAGKVTQLKPETAYFIVQALRGWNARADISSTLCPASPPMRRARICQMTRQPSRWLAKRLLTCPVTARPPFPEERSSSPRKMER